MLGSITLFMLIGMLISHTKTLDDFDFSFQEQLNEGQIRNLASLNFIEQKKTLYS